MLWQSFNGLPKVLGMIWYRNGINVFFLFGIVRVVLAAVSTRAWFGRHTRMAQEARAYGLGRAFVRLG